MTTDDRMETYLAAATAGLKDDRELQLDVQAELRSHIAATVAAYRQEGRSSSDEEALAQALQALGPVTDLAPELAAANRRRMKERALARVAIRALLVPAAVVLALSTLPGLLNMGRLVQGLSGDFVFDGTCGWPVPGHRLTSDQQLVLRGDPSRTNDIQRERAIWEAHPTNLVYLGNYITHLTARYDELAPTAAERLAVFRAELEQARRLDPDNARYHYLLADKLLEQAAELISPTNTATTNEAQRYAITLKVKDPELLRQAMEELRSGLGKPALRRYAGEMLDERFAILGAPRSMAEQTRQIGMAARVPLPDLGIIRRLARVCPLYAARLIEQGQADQARLFLGAWETLARQLNADTYCLIDQLLVNAIVETGRFMVPPVWEKAGDDRAAERARHRALALGEPVRRWRGQRSASHGQLPWEEAINRHGGLRARLLLPPGETPSMQELTPSRLLDYVLAEQFALFILMLVMLTVMLAALIVALRWRLARGGTAGPLLLLPNARQSLRILGGGVLLPLALYFVLTRWIPSSSRQFSITLLWPKMLMQVTALASAVVMVTGGLMARAVRERCVVLGIPVPDRRATRWRRTLFGGLLAVLVFAGYGLPDGWFAAALGECPVGAGPPMAVAAACLLILLMLARGLWAWGRSLFGPARFGLFYGTTARSLIPAFAAAVILLSLLGRSYLRTSERTLIACDTILRPTVGVTAAEARFTERLQREFFKAAAELDGADAVSR